MIRNGYLYPVESGYDSSTFYNNTNTTSLHNKSFTLNKQKYKLNYQQQLQQQLIQQHQMQQQQQQQQFHSQHTHQHRHAGPFAKLLENAMGNNTGTIHSNTNNTNSNFFVSPTLSTESNRRHGNSLLNRIKYRLGQKLSNHCSWKALAILFLFIIINLFLFTVYLAGKFFILNNWKK